jgi:hypothetical protein
MIGTGISPVWNFASAALAGHADAFVLAAKVGDVPAPTGPPDVDWLSLNRVDGNLAKQVFRVATVGGLPPSSVRLLYNWRANENRWLTFGRLQCKPGTPPISVKYASTYCERH